MFPADAWVVAVYSAEFPVVSAFVSPIALETKMVSGNFADFPTIYATFNLSRHIAASILFGSVVQNSAFILVVLLFYT